MPGTVESSAWPSALVILEVILLIGGIATLVRWQFSSRAKASKTLRLSPWEIPLSDFLFAGFIVVFAGLVAQFFVIHLRSRYKGVLTADTWTVVQGAAFQIGMLVGALIAVARSRTKVPEWEPDSQPAPLDPLLPPPTMQVSALIAGGLVFLASLPVVHAVSFLWQQLLEWSGASVDKQDLIDLFLNADSPVVVIGLTLLAITLAPVTEEIVFRAGLFRFLRTRIPRTAAFLIPAVLFGALHASVVAVAPLMVLGLILAVAYERTGRIAVPIVAHALFNLHTLLLLLGGVRD